MRVKLDMSVAQAEVIIRALDLIGRLHMGQIDEIEAVLRKLYTGKMPFPSGDVKRLCDDIRFYAFPELERGCYYGIRSDQVADEARVGYDLIQVLRHAIAWHKKPDGGVKVDFDEPYKTAKHDMATVEVVDDA